MEKNQQYYYIINDDTGVFLQIHILWKYGQRGTTFNLIFVQ
jgi:hypothetical protein